MDNSSLNVRIFSFYLFFNLVLHILFGFNRLILDVHDATWLEIGYKLQRLLIGGIAALPTLFIMLIGILFARIKKKDIRPLLYIGVMFATAIFIGYIFAYRSMLELLVYIELDWDFKHKTDVGK